MTGLAAKIIGGAFLGLLSSLVIFAIKRWYGNQDDAEKTRDKHSERIQALEARIDNLEQDFNDMNNEIEQLKRVFEGRSDELKNHLIKLDSQQSSIQTNIQWIKRILEEERNE